MLQFGGSSAPLGHLGVFAGLSEPPKVPVMSRNPWCVRLKTDSRKMVAHCKYRLGMGLCPWGYATWRCHPSTYAIPHPASIATHPASHAVRPVEPPHPVLGISVHPVLYLPSQALPVVLWVMFSAGADSLFRDPAKAADSCPQTLVAQGFHQAVLGKFL